MIKLSRNLSKFVFALVASVVVVGTFVPEATVRANSGPVEWWYGNEGEGPKPEDSDCPLEVTSETLTFDIPDLLPSNFYNWTEDTITEYDSHVTAEYAFYNPTDETITADLVFPFSIFPYTWNLEFATVLDDRYSITVDGQAVERTVITTYLEPGVEFDTRTMIPEQIHDEDYLEDDYFYPDMPVVRYVFDHNSIILVITTKNGFFQSLHTDMERLYAFGFPVRELSLDDSLHNARVLIVSFRVIVNMWWTWSRLCLAFEV